ncbi:glucose 1-dehydrogenase [Nocardioides kongjuensis]|uniref:3alpha(Or 20beta)-hydroxysteroid dehydrogenase n=1 Tax=Nocardioides kongjuensis TaxID=349522 RepID=A0A852RLQ6_9ACTN|nr:glucose 1-dehydrogenase [Nocardioides kongjuensis]NYD31579.1 3alpha(or 20beta)-hydroxysteroid dehydrogenase [Nocardioides kongjuensis]
MSNLDNLVIIVTGGGSGIGLAAADRIVRSGATVVITGRDVEKGKAALARIGDERASFLQHDVASRASWEEVVAAVLDTHGRIDGLVNNAGLSATAAPFDQETTEAWDAIVATNLSGVFHGMQAVIPSMKDNGGGSIVNVSSTGGLVGLPLTSSYAAAKWGMRGLTRVAALELANKRIRVNSVHPGMVYTPMTVQSAGVVEGEGMYPPAPMGRVASASEIAGAIVYLLSADASYTTGAEIAVDGGWTAGVSPRALLGDELAGALLG